MVAGMTRDPRLTPARGDVAARHLEGQVDAERYADPAPCRVRHDRVILRRRPDLDAGIDTELLFGEPFDVYDFADGWAWGQSGLDGFVGYLPEDALAPDEGPDPDHAIATLGGQLYWEPELKRPPAGTLPFGARLCVIDRTDSHAQLAGGLWIPAPQICPLSEPADDWVAVAEMFAGVPYVWGGRSSAGVDCSALVQLARQAAGRDCPRDSDMQEAMAGKALARDTAPERGDLVFWKGHVGVMRDETVLLHANAHHMAVASEPIDEAAKRIEAAGGGPVVKRVRLGG